LDANNRLAFALMMVLPLAVFLRRSESSAWIRGVLLATFALSIVAVLGTYSRGSLINLGVVLVCILAVLRTRDLPVLLVIAATPVIIWLAPPRYHERIQTIAAPQGERSVRMRSKSGYVALRLGLDHPILGAGFQPFDEAVYERYVPGYLDNHNAHNHFLQTFAEHGFPGLLLFTALIVSVMLRSLRTMRLTRGDPNASDLYNYAVGLLMCFIAYVVGGMFIGQAYFEPFYQLAAAAVLVNRLAEHANPGPVSPLR
jgi:probable O-glycosylation ligase (exosortase A-associated)